MFRQILARSYLPVFALCLLASAPLYAGDTPENPKSAAAGEVQTRVEADPKTNRVLVIVGGKQVAVFDAKGLHVNGDVSFTGRFVVPPEAGLPPPPVGMKPAQ